jgi:hypothetical protein
MIIYLNPRSDKIFLALAQGTIESLKHRQNTADFNNLHIA